MISSCLALVQAYPNGWRKETMLPGKSALVTGSLGGIGFGTAILGVRQPSRRFVKDANVANLIAFLCGPAGADINGAALPIDGAWPAGR